MSDIVAASLIAEVKEKGSASAAKNLEGVGKSAEGAGGKISGFIGTVGKIAGALGVITLATSAFGFLKDAVSEGAAANVTAAQTNAVLASTKGVSGETGASIEALSQKYMALTGVQDDTVRSTANMLLTFTNIGAKGGIFDQATKTALDMSQALGQDTKSSAIQLGKALNDPITGMTALRRVGVTFDAQQIQQITTMQKSGNLMGAQKVILAELNKEFGNSAAAAGQANGGIKILGAQFDQMKQSIGQAIIPILTGLASHLLPLVTAFGNWLPGAMGAFTTFMSGKVNPILNSLATFVVQSVVPALQQIGVWVVTKGLPALQSLGQWLVTQIVPVLTTLWQQIQTNLLPALENLWQTIVTNLVPALQNLWNQVSPILVPALQTLGWLLGNVVGPALTLIVLGVSAVVDVITWLVQQDGKILGFFGRIADALGISGAFRQAWAALPAFVAGIWAAIKAPVIAGVNDVIGLINHLIDAYDSLPFASHIDELGLVGQTQAPQYTASTGTGQGQGQKSAANGGPRAALPPNYKGPGSTSSQSAKTGGTTNYNYNIYPATANFTAADMERYIRQQQLLGQVA